mmetsp:Transcript_16311/g.25364  ORF Transcript_16311/g.25364 Transcript_16311/m.25364 type:complete len:240 (-) Transcript_16311:214-933(-)|eukprot:CAMPEP_0195290326 /NCGR_PEP_ID=MMETSP0707-20130614/6238_1 /TAXON_ID=33640 /ORGANISM="Asterionellopsis glacialis, Strain CCMP134" /LENGTH=239 /DNA_ID=CAMNT_0040350441 /DNA_START=119 /DNA_END=838 /DNA_ORIENTATION=-
MISTRSLVFSQFMIGRMIPNCRATASSKKNNFFVRHRPTTNSRLHSSCSGSLFHSRSFSSNTWSNTGGGIDIERPSWSDEWKSLGLGAKLVDDTPLTNLLFVQMGFGVDQHGSADATKAAIRAVRNSIEFNSIPGVIETIPGGRSEMLIQVKLGIPPSVEDPTKPFPIDMVEVAKVFPYGKLMPFEVVLGGLSFPTGRVVEELGDTDDMAICVAAAVSIGFHDGSTRNTHKTFSTQDGY